MFDTLRTDKRDAALYALGAQLDVAIAEKDAARRCDLPQENERCGRFVEIAHAIENARPHSNTGVMVKQRLAHYLMREALDFPDDIELLTWAAEVALHVRKEQDRVCEAETKRPRAA